MARAGSAKGSAPRNNTTSHGLPNVKSAVNDLKGSVAQPFTLPRKPRSDAEAQRLYYHIRTICFWLDAASDIVRIPGLSDKLPFSFGIEAVIGTLLPVAGDIIGFVMGLYVVLLCVQFGLPAASLWKMLTNVLIDAAVGIIPIIGDLVDLAFKSNLRNLSILEDHLLHNPPPSNPSSSSNSDGINSISTHYAIRIPPSGPFWPKDHSPSVDSFFAQPNSDSKHTSSSFFSNIFGSPNNLGSGNHGGWKLGGVSKAQLEDGIGAWEVIYKFVLVLFAKISGKIQQMSRGSAGSRGAVPASGGAGGQPKKVY